MLGNGVKNSFTGMTLEGSTLWVLQYTQRNGLHEGMLHLEIMHEKKLQENQWIFQLLRCFWEGNWVINWRCLSDCV